MFDFDYSTFDLLLTLAQDRPMIPGEGSPGPAGDPAGATPTGQQQGNPMSFIWLMLGVFLIFWIFIIMGQRRERKKRDAMIAAIKKHDKVQTIGGVIGSIVELKPDFVVLKVDESSNTRITFARSAIQQVVKSAGGSGAGAKDKADDEPES
jgi:preprotein translocase subunit YajC